jgi:hypothetical protein
MDNPIQSNSGFNPALPEIILLTFTPLWAGVDNLVMILEALETGPTLPGFFFRQITINGG